MYRANDKLIYLMLDKPKPPPSLNLVALSTVTFSLGCLLLFKYHNYHLLPIIVMCNGINYYLNLTQTSKLVYVFTNILIVCYGVIYRGNEKTYLLSLYLGVFYLFTFSIYASLKEIYKLIFQIIIIQPVLLGLISEILNK